MAAWGARARWRGPARSSRATESRSCRREARPGPSGWRPGSPCSGAGGWRLTSRGAGAHWIFSGDDDERRRLLQAALDDEGIGAVLCRGAAMARNGSSTTSTSARSSSARRVRGLQRCHAADRQAERRRPRGDARPLPGLGRRAQRRRRARQSPRRPAGHRALRAARVSDLTRDWDVPETPVEGRLVAATSRSSPRASARRHRSVPTVPSSCSRRTTRRPARSTACSRSSSGPAPGTARRRPPWGRSPRRGPTRVDRHRGDPGAAGAAGRADRRRLPGRARRRAAHRAPRRAGHARTRHRPPHDPSTPADRPPARDPSGWAAASRRERLGVRPGRR